MKKTLIVVGLFLISVILVYADAAENINCSYIHNMYGERTNYKRCAYVHYGTSRPLFVPEDASEQALGETAENETQQTLYIWTIFVSPILTSPLPTPILISPLPTPLPVVSEKMEELTSGYINGVWVPVYGLPCDQLGGNPDCMCFYQHEQWCN